MSEINYLDNVNEKSLSEQVYGDKPVIFNIGFVIRIMINNGFNATDIKGLTDYMEDVVFPFLSEQLDREITINCCIHGLTNDEKKMIISVITNHTNPNVLPVNCIEWPIPLSENAKPYKRIHDEFVVNKALGILVSDGTVMIEDDWCLMQFNKTLLSVIYAFHSISNNTLPNEREEIFDRCFDYHMHRLTDDVKFVPAIRRELKGRIEITDNEEYKIFPHSAAVIGFLSDAF